MPFEIRRPLTLSLIAALIVVTLMAVAPPALAAVRSTTCDGTPRLWIDTSNRVHANYDVRCGRKVLRARVNGFLTRPGATAGLRSEVARTNPNFPNTGFSLGDYGNSLSNPRGSQRFCAIVTYGWATATFATDRTERVCATY